VNYDWLNNAQNLNLDPDRSQLGRNGKKFSRAGQRLFSPLSLDKSRKHTKHQQQLTTINNKVERNGTISKSSSSSKLEIRN
jgi:hypothetical protein